MDSNRGFRSNLDKPDWTLIDWPCMRPMVDALEYGRKCYGHENWKRGLPVKETIASLLRHTFALLAGEDNDQESKQPHIGHILSNAMFISYMLQNRPDMDNRREKKESNDDQFNAPEAILKFALSNKRGLDCFPNEYADKKLTSELNIVVNGQSLKVNPGTTVRDAYDGIKKMIADKKEAPNGGVLNAENIAELEKRVAKTIKQLERQAINDLWEKEFGCSIAPQNANIGRTYPKDPQINILRCLLSEGNFDPSDSRPIMDEILTEEINISGAPYNHKTIRLPKGITMRDALFRLEYYRRSA